MTREPGAKAQLAAAIAAALLYLATKYLLLAPVEVTLLTPIVGYVAAQVAGWLWTRRQVTPVKSPVLTSGTRVTVTDAAGTPESTQTLS